MKKRTLEAPQLDVAYKFRFENGHIGTLAYTGKTNPDNGKLVFINTTYGTKTELTPARFSFAKKFLLQETLPYSLINHYPEAMGRNQRMLEDMKRMEEIERKKKEREKKETQIFNLKLYKLRTLPIDVEYTVAKEVGGISPREFAIQAESHFGLQEATLLSKFEDLLKGTPYELPSI